MRGVRKEHCGEGRHRQLIYPAGSTSETGDPARAARRAAAAPHAAQSAPSPPLAAHLVADSAGTSRRALAKGQGKSRHIGLSEVTGRASAGWASAWGGQATRRHACSLRLSVDDPQPAAGFIGTIIVS